MKSLWFKAEFVDPILKGSKTDTIRKVSTRLPAKGDRIALSVGPRAPFAHALIVSVRPVARVSAQRIAALASIYGPDAATQDMVKLRFRLAAE